MQVKESQRKGKGKNMKVRRLTDISCRSRLGHSFWQQHPLRIRDQQRLGSLILGLAKVEKRSQRGWVWREFVKTRRRMSRGELSGVQDHK